MTSLTAVPGWDEVPQIEKTTPLKGGPGGELNWQAQALINRTEFLNILYRGSANAANPRFAGGAKGDGVADDTAALLAWLDAGGGHLPPGTFIVSASGLASACLRITRNDTRIVGAGKDRTFIKMKDGQDCYVIRGDNITGIHMADLTIDGNNTKQSAAGKSGVYLALCKQMAFERVVMRYAYGHGFFVSSGDGLNTDSDYVRFLFCHAYGNGWPGLTSHGTGFGLTAGDIVLVGCRSEGNNLGGFKTTGKYVRYDACYAFGNTSNGFSTDFDTPNQGVLKYIGCIARANGANGFYLSQTTDSADLIGCTSDGNGLAGLVTLNNVQNVRVNGGEYKNNTVAGIQLRSTVAAAPGRITITGGVRCFDDQAVKTQAWGILISDGADNVLIDSSVDLEGNLTGALSITTTGQNIVVKSGVRGLTSEISGGVTQTLTGTTAETTIVSRTIKGGEMSRTGVLRIRATGGASGVTGTKQARLYVGGVPFFFYTRAAAETDDWYLEARIHMTTLYNNMRRSLVAARNGGTVSTDTTSIGVDTRADWEIKITGTLGNAADSVFVDSFEIERVR